MKQNKKKGKEKGMKALNLALISALILTIGGAFISSASAANNPPSNNQGVPCKEGSNPGINVNCTLARDGDMLYGTYNKGTAPNRSSVIFRVNRNGRDYYPLVVLKEEEKKGIMTQSVIKVGNTLYGIAEKGGTFECGTIFSYDLESVNFKVLHHLEGGGEWVRPKHEGKYPQDSLTYVDPYLYGVTECGGKNRVGTIFRIKKDVPESFETLHHFCKGDIINGASPKSTVIGDKKHMDGYLYGTTCDGGAYRKGVIYRIDPEKQYPDRFKIIHHFEGGGDGFHPYQRLAWYRGSNSLYGTTSEGGADDAGTIYKIHRHDYKHYEVIRHFNKQPHGKYCDGFGPKEKGPLIYHYGYHDYLVGVTGSGGTEKRGTFFKVGIDNKHFRSHSFGSKRDNYLLSSPVGGLAAMYNRKEENRGHDYRFYGIDNTGKIFNMLYNESPSEKHIKYDGLVVDLSRSF